MSKKLILSTVGILIILLAMLLEVRMLTVWKNYFGPRLSPFLLLGSGLVSGIGFLIFFYKKEVNLKSKGLDYKKILPAFLLFGWGVWKCGQLLYQEILAFPQNFYDQNSSDVIPQIGIMVERFLSGEFPYQVIPNAIWKFDHSLFPTYLPFTWGPFIVPDLFQFDYRWMAFGVLGLSLLWYLKKVTSWNPSYLSLFVLIGAPFFFLLAFQENDTEGVFKFSVETLITGYYLLLALSVLSKSSFLKGAALVLCLLSRYAVVLWVPLFFFVLFLKEPRKNIYRIGGVLLAGFVIFYALPFLSQDASIFWRGYQYHSDGAVEAWKVLAWQGPGELPHNLYKGYGFGWFFYENWAGDLVSKVTAYRYLHLSLSLSTIGLLGGIFLKIKDKIDHRIFLLGSLKIYLVIFYNFIQIPFGYLFLIPAFLSIPILALLILNREIATSV